jgi:selenium-binding protein 1
MVEVSRDGRRVYVTNSLYAVWDGIFYPEAWAPGSLGSTPTPEGGLAPDLRFFPHDDDCRGLRVHQVRLQGGDASSDSYCFVD